MTSDTARSISDLIQFLLLGGFGLWLLGAFSAPGLIDDSFVAQLPQDAPLPPTPQHCYSHNGENYHGRYDALIDVCHAAFEVSDIDSAHIAEVRPVTAGSYINRSEVMDLIERLVQSASNDVGEAAEDWLDPGDIWLSRYEKGTEEYQAKAARRDAWHATVDDLAADIATVVDAWADRHGLQPQFYGVTDPWQMTRAEYEQFAEACGGTSHA